MKRKTERPGSDRQRQERKPGVAPRKGNSETRSANQTRPGSAKPARSETGKGVATRRPANTDDAPASRATNPPDKRKDRPPAAEPQVVARPLTRHQGPRPAERVPVILETTGEDNYRLMDSGDGLKLERYGEVVMIRPEAQALWPPSLAQSQWDKAGAVFTGDTDEEGMGRWRFPHAALAETWPMQLLGTDFLGRFTSFRHVGVFPEQIVHWAWMADQIRAARRPVKVLNLFGYTGVASLIAASAGSEVTHVDASKKAIGWGRENQALAGLENRPIRWICEDAMKFILREERRGNSYDIILTDPPRFGRGPAGEVWELYDHIALMLDICRGLLSPQALGLVLTAYSIRASFYSIHELMMETMRGKGGAVESGELVIRETGADGRSPGRALSTSLFSRWVPA